MLIGLVLLIVTNKVFKLHLTQQMMHVFLLLKLTFEVVVKEIHDRIVISTLILYTFFRYAQTSRS